MGRGVSIGRGPIKPAADTSDTADIRQKLLSKKEVSWLRAVLCKAAVKLEQASQTSCKR